MHLRRKFLVAVIIIGVDDDDNHNNTTVDNISTVASTDLAATIVSTKQAPMPAVAAAIAKAVEPHHAAAPAMAGVENIPAAGTLFPPAPRVLGVAANLFSPMSNDTMQL